MFIVSVQLFLQSENDAPLHLIANLGSVDDISGLARLLRSGRWKNDSYSGNDVWGTLCARGDLDPVNPAAYGCMDAKVSGKLISSL